MSRFLWIALVALACTATVQGFVQKSLPRTKSASASPSLLSSSLGQEAEDNPAIQWELFNKHHAKGSWKGVW